MDWYLFQLIPLLKPIFYCCNSFALSWFYKVTTKTRSFVYVIANVRSWLSAVINQFSDQRRKRLGSQLINSISRVLQKLLKYFNGTIFWTSSLPSFLVWPAFFCLDLNEALSISSGRLNNNAIIIYRWFISIVLL